ncbi:MAG: preprotein translocase subunit SecA [Chloroflexi bacterium]|nr:preprotein translocase subunit SecA [Chloroflexota bacterium]
MVGKIVGESNKKALNRTKVAVAEIGELEEEFAAFSDEELRALTVEFKERLAGGEELDDLLPEAFAAVREVSKRVLGLRHFDVQMIGGIVLHRGKIAEMRTGEGKTLVATLPAYLNALGGAGVHVITVNDYLSKRDAGWMGQIYHALGLTVGCLQHESSLLFAPEGDPAKVPDASDAGDDGDMEGGEAKDKKEEDDPFIPATKKEAYAADITYGTNSEFGFDYLRDNMVDTAERQVQRGVSYAIVDEVDNILIDEARTPLIISGPAPEKGQEYASYANLARRMVPELDFEIDAKSRGMTLTDEGIRKAEQFLSISNLYDPANYVMSHFIDNAIRAQHTYERDKAYVVRDGEVLIVDEFTGRLMAGRRYSEGLHQAIEAKENVKVQRESITYATITLQNYFRMYEKLSGMTGTAVTEAEELHKIYKLEVVEIPTNVPMIRRDNSDFIYRAEEPKFRAVVKTIQELQEAGRPVLVGTTSIERSEMLSGMLHKSGVRHEVLNAKNHAREATIIAEAGRPGAVTVSTNMAGRGTDIILGGNPDRLDISQEEWQRDHDRIIELGGLYVLGTERHESRRIDNQLRGRSGRQGDPGETRFFISTEDDLMRRFGGGRISWIMEKAGLEEDMPIENKMVSKAVETAQSKVEGYHFEIRKNLVDYDDVINTHRDVIYKLRQKILAEESLRDDITVMVEKQLRLAVQTRLSGPDDSWDVDGLQKELMTIFPFLPHELENPDEIFGMKPEEVEEILVDEVQGVHDQRVEEFGAEVMEIIERHILLRQIDSHWVEHLTAMENMRQGIGLQAVGQRDPLVQYKQMSFQMFGELMENIERDVAHMIYRVSPSPHIQQSNAQQRQMTAGRGTETGPGQSENGAGAIARSDPSKGTARAAAASAVGGGRSAVATVAERHGAGGGAPKGKKIGRNEPCYCGSGKKYKRCHG